MRPTILTIAGSDSSGGAGIQADLKAIAASGGRAATVITAVTAQNSRGIREAEVLRPALVAAQIEAVLTDLRVTAVKTGMLGTGEVVRTVARALAARGPRSLVCDPVMVSGTGFRLLSEEGVEAMRRDLLPLASLVTPNAPEAAMLSGLEVESADQAEEAGRRILERGAAAVLITGGHFRRDRGTDVLVTPGAVRRYVSRCLDSPEVHGTGCVLASAIATHLGGGAPLGEAIARAKALVTEAIDRAAAVGDGARFADPLFFLERESALKEVGALHVITDESVQDRFSHVDLARLCAEGGADRVQFREKRPCSTRRMVETVRRMREAAEEHGARVVVNDRVDVALAAGAAAANLGWDDLEARVARRLLGEEAVIGVTVNGEEEAQRAAALPVDYVGVGPVFGTRSKANPAPVLGLDRLRDIVRRVGKPVIAVGSITAERVAEVLDTGARGIAVLSAVVGDPDPREATRRLREALEAGRGAAAGR